jgi:mannitol/fructose-specific phosphotransferase system IIA component (Ntr-type)
MINLLISHDGRQFHVTQTDLSFVKLEKYQTIYWQHPQCLFFHATSLLPKPFGKMQKQAISQLIMLWLQEHDLKSLELSTLDTFNQQKNGII